MDQVTVWMIQARRSWTRLMAAAFLAALPAGADAASILGADLKTLMDEADLIVYGIVAGTDTRADEKLGGDYVVAVLDQVTAFKGQVNSEMTVTFSYPGGSDADGSPLVEGMPALATGNGVYVFLEESPRGLLAIGGPLGIFIDSFADTRSILTARDISRVQIIRGAPGLDGAVEPDIYDAEALEYLLSRPTAVTASKSEKLPGYCLISRICPLPAVQDACRAARDQLLRSSAGRRFTSAYYRAFRHADSSGLSGSM